MRHVLHGTTAAAALALLLASTAAAQGAKPLQDCPPDAVVAGTVCLDAYEASVWQVPDPKGASRGPVRKIQQGKATLALLHAAGAVQRGVAGDDYASGCAADGYNCLQSASLYAVSLPGVQPSAYVNWVRAAAFCATARKRLPSNLEWQVAALAHGLNADINCNVVSGTRAATGQYAACVSEAGSHDMSGNLSEWVAEWVPLSTVCLSWNGLGNNDFMCLAGADAGTFGPGALLRGGSFATGTSAGPLAISGNFAPWYADSTVGFRCAR